MNKFKWFDEERELFPSKENNCIIKSLDIVLCNIAKTHSFKTIFEDLGYLNLLPNSFEKEYEFCYGNLQEYLEKKFVSISKINKMAMFPPLYYWILQFGTLKVKITEEQMSELLKENFTFYNNRIKHSFNKIYELSLVLNYDLAENKFIQYF